LRRPPGEHFAKAFKQLDPYAVCVIEEGAAMVMTAKSQSKGKMSPKEFQRSKDKVLDYLANMIGTTRKIILEAVVQ
jgi:hypothetical protein